MSVHTLKYIHKKIINCKGTVQEEVNQEVNQEVTKEPPGLPKPEPTKH